jgi:multimeric flavodoxin WrbA
MNILIISGSPRKGCNTELLAEAFAKGAAEHHHVEIVSVHDYKVNPCLGCNACFKTNGICAQKDDMAIIYDKMDRADMLASGDDCCLYYMTKPGSEAEQRWQDEHPDGTFSNK